MSNLYNIKSTFPALLLFSAIVSLPSQCLGGPLRILTPGGPDSAFGTITFSEGDIDLMRPADMATLDRGRFSLTKESESIIDQKQGNRTLNLSSAKKQRIDFFYPAGRNRKYRSAFGGSLYRSNLKYITDEKLDGSFLYNKGSGSSAAFAQQLGRFTIGVYRNTSGNDGYGMSSEINSRVELLAPDAELFSSLSARREGVHIKASLNRRMSAGYIKETQDIRGIVKFTDGANSYIFPATIGAERREANLEYGLGRKYTLGAFYNHGSLDNLDSIKYNSTFEIGRWLSAGEYDTRSFFLKKQSSPDRATVLGYEDYDGYFRMAGTVDLLGSIADLLAGFYLFHSHGYLHRETYKYSLKKKKGNYTYRFMYAYSTGDAFLHFDSSRRVFFNWNVKSNESITYDYTQHQLGLGIEKEIRKDVLFRYSLLQVVPLFDKVKEQTISPGGTSAPLSSEKKKTRGGTLHLFSVIFLL